MRCSADDEAQLMSRDWLMSRAQLMDDMRAQQGSADVEAQLMSRLSVDKAQPTTRLSMTRLG